jgi:hypothetical protein
VDVLVEASSIAPLDSLQILVNGEVVTTVPARDPARVAFQGPIPMPEGGWIAARVLGPPSDRLGDDYAFAHTSPVRVVRGGRPWVSLDDVEFLSRTVEAIWARVEDGPWRSDGERGRFRAAVDSARAAYARIAAAAR